LVLSTGIFSLLGQSFCEEVGGIFEGFVRGFRLRFQSVRDEDGGIFDDRVAS
jgi:hypothetical protein